MVSLRTLAVLFLLMLAACTETETFEVEEVSPALNTELIGCWDLADNTDYLGNYDLEEQGTISYVSGKVGNAAEFTGTSGQMLNNSDFWTNEVVGLGAITVSAWIESDNGVTDKGWIIGTNPRGQDEDGSFRYDSDSSGTIRVAFDIGAGTKLDVESASGVQTTSWQHVLFRWNQNMSSGTPDIWIDGSKTTLSVSDSETGVIQTSGNGNNFIIGAAAKESSSSWDGLVDSVMIWSKYLSDSEIAEVYNSGSGIRCSDAAEAPAGDSCDTNDWDATENCEVTGLDAGGNTLTCTGSGTIRVTGDVTNCATSGVRLKVDGACNIQKEGVVSFCEG